MLRSVLLLQVVFVGTGISSAVWGIIFDKYGRRVVSLIKVYFLFDLVILAHGLRLCVLMRLFVKQGLMICMVWIMYFGLLSSFAPVYGWFLFLRGLVGVGLGGAPQA